LKIIKDKEMDQSEYTSTYNKQNGRFLKGNVPANKGRSWSEWMPKKAQKKILANLDRVRPKGGNPIIPGYNRKKVVMVTPKGNCVVFESATEAARLLNLQRRNISHCCEGKRHRCGGRWWFFFDDDRWTVQLKKIQKELEASQSI
jgi:hypothetical protein